MEAVIDSVTRARRYADNVEWSAEDALAHRAGFPVPLHRERDQAGATTINIPDTVGYACPRSSPS